VWVQGQYQLGKLELSSQKYQRKADHTANNTHSNTSLGILKGSSKLHEHYMNASPRLNLDSVFDMYYIEYRTAPQDLVCACAEQAHFVSYH